MIDVNSIHKGVVLKIDGNLWVTVQFQHVNPGKGGAFVRTKLKNVTTGQVMERTFRSADQVEDAEIDERKATFQYYDGDMYHFMDVQNFEQYALSEDVVDTDKQWLKENMEVNIELYEGKPITLLLPNFVVLKVTTSENWVKGDTVSGSLKPVEVETGASVSVPLFIKQNEMIKIDTRTGEYVERVNK